ncbi:MAG: (2Fe-2S)-binding protein [Pseudomonadota bacterium]
MTIALTVNGTPQTYDGDPDMPLLWYLRDTLKLKGTKFGCGIASCGACTVHVDGSQARTCVTPMAAVEDSAVTTIEGLAAPDGTLHPVQQAWIEEDVPQCGYCQAGQIMATADLLSHTPDPTDEDIDQQMNNLCRCGTYARIRKAVYRAAALQSDAGSVARAAESGEASS